MALQEHARLPVFADGTFLESITSVDFRTESGQQRVETLEGLAGFTPGSGICTVTLNSAVPIGGEEFPFQIRCQEGTLVTLQVGVGSKSYAGNGKVMDVSFSQSVNGNTEQATTWEGEFKKLQ